mgnify:CR=1 FL=1
MGLIIGIPRAGRHLKGDVRVRGGSVAVDPWRRRAQNRGVGRRAGLRCGPARGLTAPSGRIFFEVPDSLVWAWEAPASVRD